MKKYLSLAVLLIFFPSLTAPAKAPVPSPTGVRLRSLSATIKPIEPVAPSALSDSLKLKASRGETLNFTLKAEGTGCFKLKPGLIGTAGQPPQAITRFLRILPFKTKHPSFKGARVGRYWDPVVPQERFCFSGTEPLWILGEIRVRKDAKAGNYKTTITVLPEAVGAKTVGAKTVGTKTVKTKPAAPFSFDLKIWPMTMPESPSLPLYAELTTWYLLLGHHGKWHEGEGELGAKYIEAMLDHRIYPLKSWVRPLSAESGSISLGAGEGKAVDSFMSTNVRSIPTSAYVSVPPPEAAERKSGGARYFSELQKALEKEKIIDRSVLYLWDEPQPDEFADMKKLGALARKNAPKIKTLVTTTYRADLAPLVDIFVPVLDQFDRPGFPAPSVYKAAQKKGKELWLYVSCMSHGCGNDTDSGSPDMMIDRGGAWVRSLAWVGSKYGVDSLLYYSVDDGYKHYPEKRDPWVDLWDFSGNGDGTLFYPGRPGMHGLTSHGPVASLRLKLWRQASFDAEYIHWMNALPSPPAWWKTSFASIVKSGTTWSKNEAEYEALREKIGNYLEAQKK